ncbi:hypothetical protein FHS68_002725 [Dyadobacter arcticus]|uniref:Glycosyltransferase RgtA/B/C/D-like domain-containing protein n=1 Tax=Dyadobacter arcticus TaxID=1078754 RepID=A0ABX0UPT9_9BACT|nr:hypothetical protein [Dyadobacter arcticus]
MELLRKCAGLGLILVPIVYFYLLLDAHTVNIPYTDDFVLLESVYHIQHAPDFISGVKILFSQVNQHRFAFERIVMLIMVFLTGTVNIKTQILLGNLSLLGISYLLFGTLKKEQASWYYFIPIPYVLFNLVYFENASWGIAALQNTPLILFAFLTAYCIGKRDDKGFYLGLTAALLTTFTSGSGLLTWIVGAALLLFQKRYKLLSGWVAAAVAIICFYFLFDYYIIPASGEKVWKHPLFNLISLFGFWGNALYLDIRHPVASTFYTDLICCVLLGAGMAVLFISWFLRIIIKRTLVSSDWFLWGAMMFVMGTGAMFVISRPLTNYLMYGGNIFSRRYMIFGIALLAISYVCLIIFTKDYKFLKRTVAGLGMLAFLLLNFVSYYLSIVQVRKLHDDLVIDSYFWKNYKTFLTAGEKFGDIPFWNHPTRMKDLINNLEKSGLSDFYQFNNIPDQERLIAQTADDDTKFKGNFNAAFKYRNTDNNVMSKYYRFELGYGDVSQRPKYFVLASPAITIVLPAVPVPNSFTEFLKTRTYYSNNYSYSLFKTKLPTGNYKAWAMFPNVSQWKSIYTGKQVSLY